MDKLDPHAPHIVAERVPRERAQFRALLVSNPNYFGNLAKSMGQFSMPTRTPCSAHPPVLSVGP